MYGFWASFYQVCGWLVILIAIAFIGVIVYIVTTVVALKNTVLSHAKRLYQPPTQSGRNLIAAGKGILLQEQVRILHISGQFKEMALEVKNAASHIGDAAKTIHPEEIKAAVSNVQSTFRFISAITQLLKKTSTQNS